MTILKYKQEGDQPLVHIECKSLIELSNSRTWKTCFRRKKELCIVAKALLIVDVKLWTNNPIALERGYACDEDFKCVLVGFWGKIYGLWTCLMRWYNFDKGLTFWIFIFFLVHMCGNSLLFCNLILCNWLTINMFKFFTTTSNTSNQVYMFTLI